MSPSHDRKRDLVGQNQHRPGDALFPISNWAVLTCLTGLHVLQRTDCNMHFHDECLSFLMNYCSSLWGFGILTHGTCSQPKAELCPENFGECVIQNIWKRSKSKPPIAGPINKTVGTRQAKMWAVLMDLTMCGRMPALALLWLNQPKLNV